MARYNVATAKDHFSTLIDKALAGEEVVITRHGKPVLEWRPLSDASAATDVKAEWIARLRELRADAPAAALSYLELKRMDEGDGLI